MSNQQQQTAEKSVQTHDSSGSTTLLLTNNPENTATEVANTLVSMATGRQRGTTTVKQLNVINVPNQTVTTSSLPILSLADYTTSRGVPTASALANQAKLTPRKSEGIVETNDDEISMSTDDLNSTNKSRRGKKRNKSITTSKTKNTQSIEAIQYGPILVKPRKHIAPTLSSGRKSKDEPLPPDEDLKRKQRRDRNKQAAAKCRRKRNDLREQLEKAEQVLVEQQQNLQRSVQTLADQKQQLEILLNRHACLKRTQLPIINSNTLNVSKTDIKTIPTTTLLDPNNSKRVTINFTNAQDLFAVAPLTRTTSTNDNSSAASSSSSSSSTVPMITIHIIPEVAQALLGSTSVDKTKLVELLQQANTINLTSTPSITTNNNNNNHVTTDSMNSTN